MGKAKDIDIAAGEKEAFASQFDVYDEDFS